MPIPPSHATCQEMKRCDAGGPEPQLPLHLSVTVPQRPDTVFARARNGQEARASCASGGAARERRSHGQARASDRTGTHVREGGQVGGR